MRKILNRLALFGATTAVAATSLVGVAAPAQAASTSAWRVELAPVPPVTTAGSTVTLEAVTSQDVGPTPYWIEIFDLTTGSLLRSCGSGLTCSTSVWQGSPTTHTYVAYVADGGNPPGNIQASSVAVPVTWEGTPQPPSIGGGPAEASTFCNSGTQVIDQITEGVHTTLYTLAPSPSKLEVCVRVDENGFGLGGEFIIQEPAPSVALNGLGAPTTDSNFTACQTTPGNTVPGFHPIEQGSVGGTSVLFDAYANASTAWVCLWSPGTQTRLVVPIPQASVNLGPPTSIVFVPDPGTPG